MDINISKREPQLAFLVPGATNAPITTKDAQHPAGRPRRRHGGHRRHLQGDRATAEDRVPGLSNIPHHRPPVQAQVARRGRTMSC